MLENKVILVTGSASGMGRAHVEACLRNGAKVVGLDLQEPPSPTGSVNRVLHLKGSVASTDDWELVTRQIEEKFGRLDGLVNNAGILSALSLSETTPEEFDRIISVNQRGVYLGMRACLDLFRKSGGGSIVNIASTAGLVGIPECFAYSASKFAVRGMTKAAAIELASSGIRVNVVCPGDTLTPMIKSLSPNGAVPDTTMYPLGRYAHPTEISPAVIFLLSDAASYITGAEIPVDGGYTAQ